MNKFIGLIYNKIIKLKFLKIAAVFLAISVFLSSIFTYFVIFHHNDPLGPDPSTVMSLMLTDLILFLLFTAIVSHRLVKLWIRKKRGLLGSKLQTRIVLMFSAVAIIPTIIISGFSTLFFNYSIQAWFNKRVHTALEESVQVAKAYLDEHNRNISADAFFIGQYLSLQAATLRHNYQLLQQIIQSQANLRGLTEAIVFEADKVIASSRFSLALNFELIPWAVLDKVNQGNVVVLTSVNDDKVRAILRLDGFDSTYLMIGRLVDSKVLHHMSATQGAVNSYREFQSKISSLQIQFSMIFLLISLLLLLAAIWAGISFASDIVKPVVHLFYATKKIESGNLNVKVEEGKVGEEIATLARAFNQMTAKLNNQHTELTKAYRDINERRIFIEAVLSGISAGVMTITHDRIITLFNSSAQELLSLPNNAIYMSLDKLVPEIVSLIKSNKNKSELSISRNRKTLTISIRIDVLGNKKNGYIITFDDISKLVAAKRAEVWSDVARRIAHEIKNPITPIYLAAERINNKYYNEITSDKETFTKYIDTIIRHVTSISKIVDEFTNFTRMPIPVFTQCNICKIIKDTAFSGQFSNKDIEYVIDAPDKPLFIAGDENQISLMLINLFKNSCESIYTKSEVNGCIHITITEDMDKIIVDIQDNGIGFPDELIYRITEPYITTKNNGTGLGLAIVKKIADEHDASISFHNTKSGALVKLIFSKYSIC